jgi:hypothetical protein
MKAHSLRILGSLLGTAALAGLSATGACTPTVRDFGTGGSGGSSTAVTTASTGGGGSSACTPGSKDACYGGPAGTQGKGLCKAGERVCNAQGDGYGPCMGEVTPKPEDCKTAEDEDCDGKADPCPFTALWANAPATAGNDNVAHGVAVDDQGFVYVAGTIDGSVAFDPSVDGQVTSAGGDDIYVARYAPNGTFQWVKTYGDSLGQTATAIAVGKNGHVYVGGYFDGKVVFSNPYHFISQGGHDAFVVELDQNGNTLAAVVGGAVGEQRITSLVLGPAGEVIVGGIFTDPFSFTGGPLLQASGEQQIFLARFDGNLVPLDAHATAGAGQHELGGLAIGPDGSLAFTGRFDGDFSLFGSPPLSTALKDDIVVGRTGPGMNGLAWIKSYNGADQDLGAGVAVDSQGNVLLGGYFGMTMNLGNIMLVSPTDSSLFLAKLSPQGEPLWAHTYGGGFAGLTLPVVLATTANDGIVVGGCFYGSADFGGGPLTSPGAPNDIGAIDAFLAELGPGGEYVAAKSFGNTTVQAGLGLALGPQGSLLYCGATGGQLDFGTGPVGPVDPSVISPFLAKLTP